jgi:hypothetical protein
MAGYSATRLPKKLGIKAGHLVALVQAPDTLEEALGVLPEGARLQRGSRSTKTFDVILLFAKSRAVLERHFRPLAAKLDAAGGLWIAWPKKASGVATDLTERDVRAAGLALGLVDNKVCAIDDTWSGLRFVYRVEDRPKGTASRTR